MDLINRCQCVHGRQRRSNRTCRDRRPVAARLTGYCLTAVGLIFAQTSWLPPQAFGQVATSYEAYFRPARSTQSASNDSAIAPVATAKRQPSKSEGDPPLVPHSRHKASQNSAAVPDSQPAFRADASTPGSADISRTSPEPSSRRASVLANYVDVRRNVKRPRPTSPPATLNVESKAKRLIAEPDSGVPFRRTGTERLRRHRSFIPRSSPAPSTKGGRSLPFATLHPVNELRNAEPSVAHPRRTAIDDQREKAAAAAQSAWQTIQVSGLQDASEFQPPVRLAQPPAVADPPSASADAPSSLAPALAPRTAPRLPVPAPTLAEEEIVSTPAGGILRSAKQLGTNIEAPGGEFPTNVAAGPFSAAGQVPSWMSSRRRDAETVVYWDAPAVAYRPLYFEDINLERHGYSAGVFQPALSAAHFFGRLPALPYLMVSERHHQAQYSLGHYRPGSQAPYVWYLPRPSAAGGVAEAAAVTGLLFAFP